MTKFGYLYLNNGQWNGTNLISPNWISESKGSYSSLEVEQGHGTGYGYQWWIYRWANAYAARGSLLVDFILPSAGFSQLILILIISLAVILCDVGLYFSLKLYQKKNLLESD